MKLTGLCGGLAMLMFVAELNGQTAKSDKTTPARGTAIVTVGCVNRAEQTGSPAGAPGVPPASPAKAPELANTQELTGALLLNFATAPNATDEAKTRATAGDSVRTAAVTYVLDGLRPELERHLGHQVEVTGTLQVVKEGPPAMANTVSHIQVSSVTLVAPMCPKPVDNDK